MRPPTFSELLSRFPALREIAVRRRLRSIPFVQQLTATECGAACLAMVLRYYGKAVPLEDLRTAAVSSRDATDAQTLIDTGRSYGLRGRAVSIDTWQLKFLERGAILHWDFSHFVVFDGLSRGYVKVVDPRRGRRRVALDQFDRSFTGVAILFEPDGQFSPATRSRKPLVRYLRQVLSERGFLPHIFVASGTLQVMALGLPLMNRVLIDRVIPHRDYDLLLIVTVGIVFVSMCQAVTALVRSHLLLYLRTRLDARMTVGFVDHMLELPFEFFQRRSAGDLLMRVSSNTTVRDILTGTVLSSVLDVTLASGYLVLLLMISPPMAGVTAAMALAQSSVIAISRHRQKQFLAESLDAQAKSHGFLMETLSAVETLKSLGAERRAVERWSGMMAREFNVALQRGTLDAKLDAASLVVRVTSSMVLLGTGTLQVLSGRLSLGDMIAVTAIANSFLTPLISLAASGTRLQVLGVYLERLTDVLQTPTEREQAASRQALTPTLKGSFELDNVSFRYGPVSPLVVRRVSLTVRSGEFVAIVGRSGSGKSTLARLLVGLYMPIEGQVLVDGVSLERVDLGFVRRQIGVVTQQAQLFSGSIRSNIALSDPSLPLDRVVRAAEIAQLHDEIEAMPMGYDTVLIDRGGSLSGGQQQRVALARALISEPKALMLDEATSQLDAATELAVQKQLADLKCTRIVIAHRLSTVMRADRIIVIETGVIVEEGRHEDLLNQGGIYASLVTAQMSSVPVPSETRHYLL